MIVSLIVCMEKKGFFFKRFFILLMIIFYIIFGVNSYKLVFIIIGNNFKIL